MFRRLISKTATIGFRLFLAFSCIFFILILQSTVAFYRSRNLMEIQRSAMSHQLQILAFRDKVSHLRIKVFNLLGTVDPREMEQLKQESEELFVELSIESEDLHIPGDLLTRSQETYRQIIQRHWDFQTTQAYELMNSSSAEDYEVMYGTLDTMSQKIESTMKATVVRGNIRFRIVTLLFFGAGLAVVALWGWYLKRSIATPITQAVGYAQMIAAGDLSMTIEAHTQDETGQLLRAFQTMASRLNSMLAEVETLIHAVQAGKLDVRGDARAFTGGWHDLIHGMNTVFDAFIRPINMTATYTNTS